MSNWRCNGQFLELFDDDTGSWIPYCEAFGVREKTVNLLSNAQMITLFVDSATTGLSTKQVSPSALLRQNVLRYMFDLGLQIPDTDEEVAATHEILLESAKLAPVHFQHDRAGFATIDDQRVFLLNTPIGLTGPKATSHHLLQDVFTPRGTLDGWKALMAQDVLGHVPLELALAIGAVAPVAHLLREAHLVTDMPLIALIGPSSGGKTTSIRCSASLWALPTEQGMIDDLNATENAFLETIARNVGLPSFIDETSTGVKPSFNLEQLCYFLPKGKGKKRCTSDGTLKRQLTFSGAVVFTSEDSLLKRMAKNQGLHARLIEFNLEKWTHDATHAERLAEGCCQNYGAAGPELVKWLLAHEDLLPGLFTKERDLLASKCGNLTGVEIRIIKSFALLMVAARALCESLDLELHMEALRTLLCRQLLHNRPERDLVTRAYAFLQTYIAENGSKFVQISGKGERLTTAKDVWGEVDHYKGQPCLWLSESRFDIIMERAGVHSHRDVLSAFASKGWIADFGDRHYFRDHTINGCPVNACCIFRPNMPSIYDRLAALPQNAKSEDLAKVLHDDPFFRCCCEQMEDDRAFINAASETDKLVFGLLFPCAQGKALAVNGLLSRALRLEKHVFLTVIPDERTILLSCAPIAQGSLKLGLRRVGDLQVNTRQKVINNILKAFNLILNLGEGLAFFEISVDVHKGYPVAVIKLDTDSTLSCVRTTADTWELPDDIVCEDDITSRSNVSMLLSNDDETT